MVRASTQARDAAMAAWPMRQMTESRARTRRAPVSPRDRSLLKVRLVGMTLEKVLKSRPGIAATFCFYTDSFDLRVAAAEPRRSDNSAQRSYRIRWDCDPAHGVSTC